MRTYTELATMDSIYQLPFASGFVMSCLFIFALLFAFSFSVDLPSNFPKCCVNDPFVTKCIEDAAKKVKPFIRNGIKEIGIETLYPIVVPTYKLNYGNDDANFVTKNVNFTLYGMDDYRIEGLEFKPKEISMKGKFVFKELFTHCLYTIEKGTILNIPIIGNGIFGGILGPLNITFNIKGSLVNRNGQQYAKLDDYTVTSEIESFVAQFQGLKIENGPWGNTNEVFRNNSKLIGRQGSLALDAMFKTYSQKYLEWLLNEIPYNKLFPC